MLVVHFCGKPKFPSYSTIPLILIHRYALLCCWKRYRKRIQHHLIRLGNWAHLLVQQRDTLLIWMHHPGWTIRWQPISINDFIHQKSWDIQNYNCIDKVHTYKPNFAHPCSLYRLSISDVVNISDAESPFLQRLAAHSATQMSCSDLTQGLLL